MVKALAFELCIMTFHLPFKADLRWIKSVLREYPSSANWSHPENGTTPLMYAAMLGHLDVAALLVRNDADIERQDYSGGWTALMHAVFHG